jgi:hypothetical protein
MKLVFKERQTETKTKIQGIEDPLRMVAKPNRLSRKMLDVELLLLSMSNLFNNNFNLCTIICKYHTICPNPNSFTEQQVALSRRVRPTLKPAQIITKDAQQFVDIYRFPPSRPDTLYPQPIPDKTAAKCRKDVCQLPDCSCGGKDIPGNDHHLISLLSHNITNLSNK